MKTKIFVNILMILLFAFPFAGSFCKIFNILPMISTVIVYVELIAVLACFFINFNQKKEAVSPLLKVSYFIYIVYVIYVLYDIFIEPKVYRKDMLGVPADNISLLQGFCFTSIPLLYPTLINKNLNYVLFAKFLAVIPTVIFPLYFSRVDYMLYVMYGASEISSAEMYDENIIGAFSIAAYASWAIIANLTVKGKWSRFKIVDKIVFYLILMINVICVIIASKRGPILYLCVTIFLYYLVRYQKYRKRMIYIVLISMALLWGIVEFAGQLDFAQGLITRFMATAEDGGSGRIGSDFSVFNLAVEQIKQGFWFGSYFRILNSLRGIYPHNFFLETLMTFGFIFSMILYYVVLRGIAIGLKLIKQQRKESIIFLLFLIGFLITLSTGTLVNREVFWIPLFMLVSMKNVLVKNNKNI